MKPYLTLREEIDEAQHFLDNEFPLCEGKLVREFYLDPEVDTGIIVPRSLLKVFIEIALRDIISQEDCSGTLSISINRSSLGILIMLADTGLRTHNGDRIDHPQSEGLKLLNSYLPLFNRQYNASISYRILNLTHENGSPGARVLITIKD
jgi:LytS/YehU family sensor histidine kinase